MHRVRQAARATGGGTRQALHHRDLVSRPSPRRDTDDDTGSRERTGRANNGIAVIARENTGEEPITSREYAAPRWK